jgi:hypothetical protein
MEIASFSPDGLFEGENLYLMKGYDLSPDEAMILHKGMPGRIKLLLVCQIQLDDEFKSAYLQTFERMVLGFLKFSSEEYMVLNLQNDACNWASIQNQFAPQQVLLFGDCEEALSMQARFPLMQICFLDAIKWLKCWPIHQVEKDKAMKKQLSLALADMFNLAS